MSQIRASLLPTKQSGFTIVELLIAGTLGLFLIAGVIQLFTGSNQNYTMQEQLADIQEDGRFALIFLKEEIEKGGWAEDVWSIRPNAINMTNSSDGVTDSVAVAYALAANSVDCNGAVVASGSIENRFYVGGTSGDELLCQGNGGGAAQPLINGVEGFQVLYGVETDTSCPDGIVNSYLTHDQYVAAGGSVLLMSVRIALLLKSDENVMPAVNPTTFQLLDTLVTTNDRFAHRLFQQTVNMPNGIYATISTPKTIMDCQLNNI